jgi:hypothetical protein
MRRRRNVANLSNDEKERRALARRTKSALAAEADAHRQEVKRRRWAEEGSRLTRAELEAGVCCRGCGLPVIDELGDWPPLMLLTDEEQNERENANQAFASRHPDCKSIRWSMSGSRAAHCGDCCPPPPLGDQQIEALARLLRSVPDTNPRGVVTSEKLPYSSQRRAVERAGLVREIEQMTHELTRQQQKIATIRRRLDDLETERQSYDD